MNDFKITCPHCKGEFPLTESLAGPLLDAKRLEYEQEWKTKNQEISQREHTLRERAKELDELRKKMDTDVEQRVESRLQEDRKRIAAEEKQRAAHFSAEELERKERDNADLRERLKKKEEKLAEAQKTEAEFLEKQRQVEDLRRELALRIQRGISEGESRVRKQALTETEERYKLEMREKDEQMSSLKKALEEAQKKANQGSQQLQGEVLELELEALLCARFPVDTIEPVPKGEFGGDILQRVVSPTGQISGTILWESKRTKKWSNQWLSTLRDNQRAANAETSILVSQILPQDVDHFGEVEGVWVTTPFFAPRVADLLRNALIKVHMARRANEGQQTKAALVYQYLTSSQFRHRIEAIKEAFEEMYNDLNKERGMMETRWKKREQQIKRIMDATMGMHGDFQGIAGSAVQEIDGSERLVLEGPTNPEF